jgi:hypothetical protein
MSCPFPLTEIQTRVLVFMREETRAGRCRMASSVIAKGTGMGVDQVAAACESLVDKRRVRCERVRLGNRLKYVWELAVP